MRIRRCVLTVLLGGMLLGLAGCNRVANDWKTAQAADTTEAYQQFVQQHQDSEFAEKAQARMRQLAEDREWQAASGQDTKEAYEQFLAQHADSKWAQEAHARLDNFQQGAATAPPATGDASPATPAVVASQPAAAAATAAPAAAPAAAVAQAAPPASEKPAAAKSATESKPVAAKAAASTAKSATKPATKTAHAASASGKHYAQLGAFSSRQRAEQEWKKIHARLGAELGSLQPHYSASKSGSQQLYRLQVGLASPQQVVELCAKLKKHSQSCIPVRS